MGGGASVRAYSGDLKDTEIIKLLAICAQDVYKLDGVLLENKLKLEKSVLENQSITEEGINIQYGVYKVLQGSHSGKTILSFRGRDSFRGTKQLIDFGSGGPYIRQCIQEAIEIARSVTPNFVCGHTIGGVFAECVSSALGIHGAVFNTLGPFSPYENYNILPALNHQNAQFVVYNTKADPICHLWGDRHIVKEVIWTTHMGEEISEESNRIFQGMKERLNPNSPPEIVEEVMGSEEGKKLEHLSNMNSMREYIMTLA